MAAPAIEYAVVRSSGPNSTTKIFQVTGFGTPTAAIIFCSNNNEADGVFDDDQGSRIISVGWFDGTNEGVAGHYSQNGVASANVGRYQNNSNCVVATSPTGGGSPFWTATAVGATLGFVTDGVKLDFSGDATSYQIEVWLFKGTDLSVEAGSFNPNTQNNSRVVSTTNEPHLVLFAGVGASNATTNATFGMWSLGAAHNGSGGISQWAVLYKGNDDGDGTSDLVMEVATNRCWGQMGAGTPVWDLEITAFGATSFTATTRSGNPGSDDVLYFVFSSANSQDDFEIGVTAAQTASGNQTFGSAFQPQGFMGLATSIQSADTIESSNEASGITFFGTDGTREESLFTGEEDNVTTMATSAMADNVAVIIGHVSSGGGTTLKSGSFGSFATTGGTVINWAGASTFAHYLAWINLKGADFAAGGTTYEDSISLGVSAGYSLGNAVVFEDSVTMAVSAGVSQGNAAVMEDDATLGVSMGLTPGENVIMEDAATFAVSAGLSTSGGLLIEDSVSLGVSAGYSPANTMDAAEAVNLGVSVGAGVDADVVIEAAISLGVSAGMTLADAGNIIEESVTFAVTAGASASSALVAAESVALAVDMGLNWTDNLTAEESVALSVSVGAQLTIDSGFLPAWAVASKGVMF